MGKEERIIFALGFIALIAAVIFSRSGNAPLTGDAATSPPDLTTAPTDRNVDFNYLTYNQPFMFAPPIANVLPQVASGQLGQQFASADYSNDISTCGC